MMRALFLCIDVVMQPLAGMLTSAPATRWLAQLGSALVSHPDVEVILYGNIGQNYPEALVVELLEALRNRVSVAVSPSDSIGAIEAYLHKRPDIVDFMVLDDLSAEHATPLYAHLVICDPGAGPHDPGAVDVRLWFDGEPRPRDMTALPGIGEGAEQLPKVNLARRAPAIERVIAIVSFVIPEFELAHLEAPGGLTVSIGERTPGVDWRRLRPGQRVECDVQGEHATRVVRARLLPENAAGLPDADSAPLQAPLPDPEQEDPTE